METVGFKLGEFVGSSRAPTARSGTDKAMTRSF